MVGERVRFLFTNNIAYFPIISFVQSNAANDDFSLVKFIVRFADWLLQILERFLRILILMNKSQYLYDNKFYGTYLLGNLGRDQTAKLKKINVFFINTM